MPFGLRCQRFGTNPVNPVSISPDDRSHLCVADGCGIRHPLYLRSQGRKVGSTGPHHSGNGFQSRNHWGEVSATSRWRYAFTRFWIMT